MGPLLYQLSVFVAFALYLKSTALGNCPLLALVSMVRMFADRLGIPFLDHPGLLVGVGAWEVLLPIWSPPLGVSCCFGIESLACSNRAKVQLDSLEVDPAGAS